MIKQLDSIQIDTERTRIVGYGAGQALLATLEEYDLPVDYVVDDNMQLHGHRVRNIPVYSPDQLLKEDKNGIFIIIFTYLAENIWKIAARLNAMGYRYGTQYVDCSVCHYESLSVKLKDELGIAANHDAFLQTKLLALYGSLHTESYIAGTWLFLELLRNICVKMEGDIAECGVFRGGNAFLSLVLLPELARKQYHLFDTFEGFPELSTHDPSARNSDFRKVNFSLINDMFSNFKNARIHKGQFRETFAQVDSERFCMVYADCDLYESTKLCCEFFYHRILPGGILLFHDYWVPESADLSGDLTFMGVNKAVNEFFRDKAEKLLVFPETSHALVIKK